jgi:D-alanyl-D-alanine carboxypeptidase
MLFVHDRAMWKTRAFVFLGLLLVLVPPAGGQARDLTRGLDAWFDALEQNGRMHGSVAIARDGKVVYRRALGMRAHENGKALKADTATKYRVGSITKVFTAVMIHQLIDEKKLSLTTPLSEFFPSIPNAERITIAHLLSHSSGIGNYPSPEAAADPGSWVFHPQSREQLLARLAALKPDYAPGEKSTYSNTNFTLLGFVLEAVTRSTYAAQLERRIRRPLGLKGTRYRGAIDVARNEARSFTYDEGRWSPHSEEHLDVAAGAGAIVSTPSDLVRFMFAIFSHRLMSRESVAEMLKPFSTDLPGSEKGIVVFTLADTNRTAYQHLGGIDAFNSSLTYLPDTRTTIAITFNGQNYPMGKVLYTLIDALAGRPIVVPGFTPVALSAETLARCEGTYVFPEIGMTIAIRREGSGLLAQANGQDSFPIDAVSETTFSHLPSGILIEFRTKAGEERPSGFVLYQGGSQMRFRRE